MIFVTRSLASPAGPYPIRLAQSLSEYCAEWIISRAAVQRAGRCKPGLAGLQTLLSLQTMAKEPLTMRFPVEDSLALVMASRPSSSDCLLRRPVPQPKGGYRRAEFAGTTRLLAKSTRIQWVNPTARSKKRHTVAGMWVYCSVVRSFTSPTRLAGLQHIAPKAQDSARALLPVTATSLVSSLRLFSWWHQNCCRNRGGT